MSWLAESIDDVSSPYDKARFEAGYAVVKDPPHKPVYAQGRCACGWKPPMLLSTDAPELWDAAVDEHIAIANRPCEIQEIP